MALGSSAGSARPLLAGRLVLLERLGEGTFAEVWRVRDTGAGASCPELALKIFRPEARGTSQRPWAVVSDEARASLYLSPHPNVIRARMLLSVRFFDGIETPALVLDLARGPTLAQWLRPRHHAAPRSLSERLTVLGGAIQGLGHVHEAGLVHRDLGFGNILISTAPLRGQLADFGAAALVRDGASPPSLHRREPHALYPSRAATNGACEAAEALGDDVHALATLGYLVLAERHPLTDRWREMLRGSWRGPDPYLQLEPSSLLELAPMLARDDRMAPISALLLRCVSRDPSLRPRSGVELRRAWNEALGGCDDEPDHLTRTAPPPGSAPR